jgi:hypothetical protein
MRPPPYGDSALDGEVDDLLIGGKVDWRREGDLSCIGVFVLCEGLLCRVYLVWSELACFGYNILSIHISYLMHRG